MTSTQKKIQILAALSLVEGIAAFLWLMSMPTNRQIYSVSRLAALFGIFIVICVSAVVLYYVRTQSNTSLWLVERITNFKYRSLLSFFLIAASLTIWVAVLYKSQLLSFINESTYQRLLPILLYIVLLLLQTGIFLLTLDQEENRDAGRFQTVWKTSLILWAIFLAIWLFISTTRLGFIHDEVGLSWGPPGTPVTFAQVNLVLAASFILVLAWQMIGSNRQAVFLFLDSKKDIVIFLGLWLMAVFFWSNQPMSATHFAPPPMPPNHEVYPNSDALIFDRSSYHLLTGIGFSNHLTRRPLYVGMLALFHKVAGGDYEKTTQLQILILALIPPMIYLLASELSNRLAGLVAGGLILLREKNSIELSGEIVTSHAKLMMSDMLAMLGVTLVVYLTVRWLSRGQYSNWAPAIIGACLGLTALIRAQVLILAPVLLLFILLSRKPLKAGMKASIFALLGLALALLPWVWRNWNLTGTFVLDDRGEERLLARNYSQTPYFMPSPSAGETEKEFSSRLKTNISNFIQTHPNEVLFFISNHFLRNMAVSSVYVAPAYSADPPSTIVKDLPFWNDWTGNLTAQGRISLFINLAVLAFGIGIAILKNKLAGLFPLMVFLLYSLGNALVRTSGWRFILPADWIILLYYSIALAYLPAKIKYYFPETNPGQTGNPGRSSWKASVPEVFLLCGLVLLGASVPIAERISQANGYDGFSEIAKGDLGKQKHITSAEIDAFLHQKDTALLSGLALYPRFIKPGARIYLPDAPSGYEYLHFWLMNEEDNQIVLSLQSPPEGIPHTAIVSVLGCKENNYISAYAVIVHQPSKQILIHDPRVRLQCPLTVPH